MLRRRRTTADDLSNVSVFGRTAAKAPIAKPTSNIHAKERTMQRQPHSASTDVGVRGTLRGPGKINRVSARPARGAQGPELEGRVNLSHRGFAFVTTADGQSYYTRADQARRLLSGDMIRFYANPPAADGSRDVRTVSLVRRQTQVLLCGAKNLAEMLYLVPDEPCFLALKVVDARPGDLIGEDDVIAVRVPAYDGLVRNLTEPGGPLLVNFVANLGQRSRPGFDLDYTRMKHGFEKDLPSELAALTALFDDPSALAPTTSVPFVTIDGDSTRDFDDAVYAHALPNGGWHVEVAIADVSHYVTPGSALDQWASGRCTSVYLPGLTLPMLPEGLSTERCSIMPGVSRRVVVMQLELDAAGGLVSSSIQREIMTSAARLTYREVAEFLAAPPLPGDATDSIPCNLRALHEVYKLLALRRKYQGRLDFEDPEPTAKLREGKWVVEWEDRTDAHKLVEELMLLANQEAAGMLMRRYGIGPVRHQAKPTPDSWATLQIWARTHGIELPDGPCLKSMADMVTAMPDTDLRAEAIMRTRMSMQPARYQTMTQAQLIEQGGHFSLSAPWYTHFTSPIRRYTDLLVHRLLLLPADQTMSVAAIQAMRDAIEICSDRAQASRQAERLMWDRLKLAGFLGENANDAVLGARVARVTPRGMRVVITRWQLSAWLSGASLRRAGIEKGADDVWRRGTAPDGAVVREGTPLQVCWSNVNYERVAYPELQVDLAPLA